MITVKMVEKNKDKDGRIIGYSLMDKNGIKKDMKSSELKLAIQEGKIQVLNLTLTSDNRLMESSMVEKGKENLKSDLKKLQKPKNKVDIFKVEGEKSYTIGYSVIHKINSIVPEKLNWYFVTPFEERYNNLKLERTRNITDSVKISYEGDSDLAIIVNAQKLYLENSKGINGEYMGVFEECDMSSLDLSNIDTSKVIDMSRMFSHCKDLNDIDLSSFDTSNVGDMCEMFAYCLNLVSLDLSGFNLSKRVFLAGMFTSCLLDKVYVNSKNFDDIKSSIFDEELELYEDVFEKIK